MDVAFSKLVHAEVQHQLVGSNLILLSTFDSLSSSSSNVHNISLRFLFTFFLAAEAN